MADDLRNQKLGLIAGNGRFPLLVLDAARARGADLVVAAIKEETFPEIDSRAAAGVEIHWISLGELGRLIETFKRAGIAGVWPSCCFRCAAATPTHCWAQWPACWGRKASR